MSGEEESFNYNYDPSTGHVIVTQVQYTGANGESEDIYPSAYGTVMNA